MFYIVTVKNSNGILRELRATEYDLPMLLRVVWESDDVLISVRIDE